MNYVGSAWVGFCLFVRGITQNRMIPVQTLYFGVTYRSGNVLWFKGQRSNKGN